MLLVSFPSIFFLIPSEGTTEEATGRQKEAKEVKELTACLTSYVGRRSEVDL